MPGLQSVDRRHVDEPLESPGLDSTDLWRRDVTLRIKDLEANVAETVRLIEAVKDDTREIVETFEAIQGAFKVAAWMGKAAKWLTAILIAAGLIYWAFKTGDLPRKG